MKGSVAFLILVLTAATLAGCAQQNNPGTTSGAPPAGYTTVPGGTFAADALSPKMYAVQPVQEMWTTASDGVRINSAVYRPDTTEKVPVYINFSPYWADTATTKGDNFASYMIDEYVPRGFAVVLTAVRGTGHSEGCFEVGSDRELKDLNEVVDFFSKQSWSTGSIAAGAKSYDATSQNGMIAKFPHPALKGIFHVEGITDMYSYTFQEGVPARVDAAAFNADYSVGQGLAEYGFPAAAVAGSPTDETPESLARLSGDAACPELAMHVANPAASMATGVKTAYWTERDWTTSIAKSAWHGSIFFVHGLQDWNVQPSHILPWLSEVQKNAGISVYAWIHQWTADDKVGGDGHVYPKRTDWNVTMLAWLDTILKNKNVGFELNDYQVQADDGVWRDSKVWPPTNSWIDVQGASNGGEVVAAKDAPVRISGEVVVDVQATSTNPDPVIEVSLVDFGGSAPVVFGEGVLRGILRDSLETPSPVVYGQSYTYHVKLFPLDHVVLAGHQVKVGFGAGVSHATPLPQQELGITYGAATLHFPTASLDTLPVQPTLMKCFTC